MNEQLALDLLHVRLEGFDGPLDLLLHLVRKKEMDIHQLRLSELTEPYLATLHHMQDLNLDVAGEFLDIASTLIYIKSKSLLPQLPNEVDELIDQEALLLFRLQAYQRFKTAAAELAALDMLGRDVFRRWPVEEQPEVAGEPQDPGLEPVSLFELLEAFRKAAERTRVRKPMEVVPETVSIENRIDELLARFVGTTRCHFEDLFLPTDSLAEVVLSFMAMLELIKQKAIRVAQAGDFGTILIVVAEDFAQRSQDIRTNVLSGLKGGPPVPSIVN